MCDAEYINKKQLKLIKLEKLLKRWDRIHYSTPYLESLSPWRCQCREDNEEKYKNKILFMLDHRLGDGKKLIKKKIIKLFTNELNKIKAIRASGNYGVWTCWLYEDTGIFPYEDILETTGGHYTFTDIKKELKKKIIYFVDKFMENDHKKIADYLSSHYGGCIDIRFRIIYSIIKEEENDYDYENETKFTPDMFC